MFQATITRHKAIEELSSEGQPYALEFTQIRNQTQRVFVHAPATLHDLYAQSRSHKDFIIYADQRLSFDEVYHLASALARALVDDYGIQRGDRVAIAMRNYPEWTVAFLAATSIGAVCVSFNALWGAPDMSFALQDCTPRAIIVDAERLSKLCPPESHDLRCRVIRVRAENHPTVVSDDWDTVLMAKAGSPMPTCEVAPDDDATIIYTSGTTGRPKGAVSTHRSIIHALLSWELDAQVRALMGVYEAPKLDHQDAMLLAVPLFHVSGSHVAMLASMRPQRKMVCMYKWDVELGLNLIEQERITVFTAAPAITQDLVRAAKTSARDLSSLQVMGGGGAHRAPEDVHGINQMMQSLTPHTGWGMTETNAIGAGIVGSDYLTYPASCGQCSAVLDMRVVDTSGVSLESGERGELQVRGTSMFNRYWNRPEADVNAFDGDWFRTGDAAIINTDGFVFIVDRIKDIVIRGGENIACNAVEAALVEHPLVIEACVYGMPDERLGEEVGATIFISAPIVEKELEDFLFARLAKFEVPRHIDQTHSPLQRGASGKILRRAIKADAITRFHKL